jgi:hypothetical protein
MGANTFFSDNPQTNLLGVATGTVGYTRFPTGTSTAKLLRFKAHPNNIGIFELVVWGNPTQDYWPISAGDDEQWVLSPSADGNARGLSDFGYRNISGTSEYLHYWLQK